MNLKYFIADAFSAEIFHGAQIAVLPAAGKLSGAQMQKVAAELNLSETVFITKVDGVRGFQARAFSPREEVSVVGHPLIAAAHVLASSGFLALANGVHDLEVDTGQQTCPIAISFKDDLPNKVHYAVSVTPTVDRFVPPRSELAAILGLSIDDLDAPDGLRPLLVACGRPYLVLAVKNRAAARRARFDFSSWSQSSAPSMLAQEILLVATDTEASSADFYGRLVGPAIGVNEDPPIGTAVPALAAWLCDHDHIRQGTYPFTLERGSRATRHSLLDVEMDNHRKEVLQLRVGGSAALVCSGDINLPG